MSECPTFGVHSFVPEVLDAGYEVQGVRSTYCSLLLRRVESSPQKGRIGILEAFNRMWEPKGFE